MEHPRQIAGHPAHERHGQVVNFDWDAYYWAPVPSKHIPFPLPHSLTRRISFDILYYVFENVDCEIDRSSITLVCKEWYRCFGGIHYSDLCIRDCQGLHSLLAQYARCERVRRRFRSTTTLRIQQRDGSSETFCDTVPLVLGTRMPAVRTLAFHGCIRPSMHPTFAKGLRLFGSIRCLELSAFILGNLGDLCRMLIGCTLLEALILRDGRYRSTYPAQTATPFRTPSQHVHLPKLRLLELRRLDTSLFVSLVDWLARTTCCENITHLTISEFTGAGARLSTRLLRAIGPSLKQLSLVGTSMRPYDYASDDAPHLGSNYNIMQIDVEIEAIDSESFRRLTSMAGHTDDRMCFIRSWWPILWTIPQHARQRIHLNVIRMRWNIYSRGYSKPIKRTMYEEDLLRLRLWEGEPICGHHVPGLGSGNRCTYIVEDVADCYRHLETSHAAIPRMPLMSFIRNDRRQWGMVLCASSLGPHWPCREDMVALPEVTAKHFVSRHTVYCRWLDPGVTQPRDQYQCHASVEPSWKALMEHITTYHTPNLPDGDLVIQDVDLTGPPIYERACVELSRLPHYERHKSVAELRGGTYHITDTDQIYGLTRVTT